MKTAPEKSFTEHMEAAWWQAQETEENARRARLVIEDSIRKLGGRVPSRAARPAFDVAAVNETIKTTLTNHGSRSVRNLVLELGATKDEISMDEIRHASRASGADRSLETLTSVVAKMKKNGEIEPGPNRGTYRVTHHNGNVITASGSVSASEAAMATLREANGEPLTSRELLGGMFTHGWSTVSEDPVMIVRNTMRSLLERNAPIERIQNADGSVSYRFVK